MSDLTYEQKRSLLKPAGKRYASVQEMWADNGWLHKWIPLEDWMPREEGAVCEKCGAYANSEQDTPCI